MTTMRTLIIGCVLVLTSQSLLIAQNAPGGGGLGGDMGGGGGLGNGVPVKKPNGFYAGMSRNRDGFGSGLSLKDQAERGQMIVIEKDRVITPEPVSENRKKVAEAQKKRFEQAVELQKKRDLARMQAAQQYAAQEAVQERAMLREQNAYQSMQLQQQQAYLAQQQAYIAQQQRQPRVSTSIGDFGGNDIYYRQSVTDSYGNRATQYGAMPRAQYNYMQQQQFSQYMMNGGIDPRTGTKIVP